MAVTENITLHLHIGFYPKKITPTRPTLPRNLTPNFPPRVTPSLPQPPYFEPSLTTSVRDPKPPTLQPPSSRRPTKVSPNWPTLFFLIILFLLFFWFFVFLFLFVGWFLVFFNFLCGFLVFFFLGLVLLCFIAFFGVGGRLDPPAQTAQPYPPISEQ